MSSVESEEKQLVNRALSAFRWVAVLRFSGQFISWLSTIFVIRFLAPEDFGIISLAELFRTFIVLFSTMGLGQGLIAAKELTPDLIRKTIGLLFIVNCLLFIIQFFSAPYVAEFYNSAELEAVLKFTAFTYLINPWSAVPFALIARELEHEKSAKGFFFVGIFCSLLSLSLAYLGYGYWALVFPIVFAAVANCIWLNIIKQYPMLPSFSFSGALPLFKFGAFVAISDLLWVAYNKVDVAIGGKYFDISELGFYAVALQLGTLLMTRVMPLFNVVAFPALARLNDTHGGSNDYLLVGLRMCSMLIFPVFFGVAFIGHNIIYLLLGEEWTRVSGMLAVLAATVPLRILAYVISPAILAADAASVNMSNSFVTLLCTIVLIMLFLPMGIMGLAIAWSASSFVIFSLTYFRGARVLSIPVRSLLVPLLQPLLAAIVMLLALELVDIQRLGNPGLIVLLQVLLGAFVYIVFCWSFLRERSRELIRIASRLAGKA